MYQEKNFNKNIDTSRPDPPKFTFVRHTPKLNSVCLVEPYDYINK